MPVDPGKNMGRMIVDPHAFRVTFDTGEILCKVWRFTERCRFLVLRDDQHDYGW